MSLFFNKIWRTRKSTPYFIIAFFFLYPFTFFYRIGFFLVRNIKDRKRASFFPVKLISIGNLSVGGTGKSVMTRYVLSFLDEKITGVVMRGYGGFAQNSLIVLPATSPEEAGDEAVSLVRSVTGVSCVVGKSKKESIKFLLAQKPATSYVVVDDGYQSWGIMMDCSILLLDARAPFGNGHCLPLGPLREKDMMRADLVILNHANFVSDQKKKEAISLIQAQRGVDFVKHNVALGYHSFDGLYHPITQKKVIKRGPLFVVAGIGSFDQFCDMLISAGFILGKTYEYGDHHAYSQKEVMLLQRELAKYEGAVTTEKDWVKIKVFLSEKEQSYWSISQVVFRPATEKCERVIQSVIKKTLGK